MQGARGVWKVTSLLLPGSLRQLAGTGSPSNGSSGTGAAKAGPGSTYFDYTNGVQWVNVGTKAAPVWSPGGGFVAYAVSSASILAMNATPVNLIAAPPAGYSVIVNNVMFQMTRTSTQYANGGTVNLVYTGGSVVPHSSTVPATVVTGAAGVVLNNNGPVSAANGIVVPTATGVDITNNTAAFITGTGTLKVYIDYSVVKQ